MSDTFPLGTPSPDPGQIGRPTRRVEGRLKVTGRARYAAEYDAPGLLHGCIVASAIPSGQVIAIDERAARAVPGVVEIFTHDNRLKTARLNFYWRDDTAPPGRHFRQLASDRILFDGQPVAVVIAESEEAARDAASLVRVEYRQGGEHGTELEAARARAYRPPHKRLGIPRPAKPRGDVEAALARAPHKIEARYRLPAEYHQPMELYATTSVWEGEGRLTVYDKTQGSRTCRAYIAKVFGLKKRNVRVVNEHVGGAFGSGLRPQANLFCAVMASLALKRPVRVVLTRQQMFHIGHRPETIQDLALAADGEGRLQAIRHHGLAATSRYEDYQENLVNWAGLLYRCANVRLTYELAKLDISTPVDMRAPGAGSGMAAVECAMDELAYEVGLDPIELRRRNASVRNDNSNKEFTAKALESCFREGAAAFGWERRQPAPRSMREGNELIGWGMSSGVWDAFMIFVTARARLLRDGRVEVESAASDIGTGTRTILAQIAAHSFGMALEQVTVRLGDSALPFAPVEGGSWTAASAGAAVDGACLAVRKTLFRHARRMGNSPLAGAKFEEVEVKAGRIARRDDPARGLAIAEVMEAADLVAIEEKNTALPDVLQMMKYESHSYSAVFAEVRVDHELGVVRVARIVCAAAAGRILNPTTARSQILGGVVMGIGMALHEEAVTDHRLGRLMNHNLAEYHVPAHADVHDVEVIFVDDPDPKASPLGVKGLGEIGVVGTAAAVANAIFHATGKRVRDFPITIDKLFERDGL
jgi:xanthine dehydrogenase YagR molybdenum-binding subunit